jgi:hypothetical protein
MRSADGVQIEFGGHLWEDTMSKAFAITSLAALALMMSVSTISAVKTLFVVADCLGGCN